MYVCLNGQFVPEEQAVVSVFDRGFLYGDGLFETMRLCHGQPFRWQQHLERLERAAEFLGIALAFSSRTLRGFVAELVDRNQMPEALLRLTLSRGVGRRGYSPRGAEHPTLVIALHPAPALNLQPPPQWRLVTSSCRLPAGEPLAQFKTCNKLPQILARAQADAAGADEALLLNTDGYVVEGSSSNLFWLSDQAVCTPPLASGILAGVTRQVVLELCQRRGFCLRETTITPPELQRVEGVFVSLSSVGIAEAGWLEGQPLRRSPLVAQLRSEYTDLLAAETGSAER
ncbi:MAG TPA: aminodeoxychorismate lyase [Bacillota bacterium]|nr:aminodeoxychorismate lyase [Bacillota bacterium]